MSDLLFPDLPKPPVDIIAVDMTSDSVTLSWDSGNDDVTESYIIRYRLKSSSGDDIYVQVTDVTDSEYTVTELLPHSLYEFHLMAVNSIGMSTPSETIEVSTKESGESSILGAGRRGDSLGDVDDDEYDNDYGDGDSVC